MGQEEEGEGEERRQTTLFLLQGLCGLLMFTCKISIKRGREREEEGKQEAAWVLCVKGYGGTCMRDLPWVLVPVLGQTEPQKPAVSF